jgi:hypothetical protein
MPRATLTHLLTALLLLFSACSAMAQTSAKTTAAAARKKPVAAAATATKRPVSGKIAPVAAHHTRTAPATAHEDNGSSRVQSRKVVVTRKLVHGHWVRTTQIVHKESGPTFQAHPDTERYQQIQQALAQKGYFKGEANGTWGDDSVAALKQFQTDQKIPNDGKISSLSLIGLGLGPNREAGAPKADSTLPVATADQPNP